MKKWISIIISSSVLGFYAMAGGASPAEHGSSNNPDDAHVSKPKLENLLSSTLAGVSNKEIIVSRVTIPANTTLPKHWHPGEEFAYVMDGSVILWQKGKADVIGRKGDLIKVPFEQIHTAKTKDEGAVILVFRVHESGKPERIRVD